MLKFLIAAVILVSMFSLLFGLNRKDHKEKRLHKVNRRRRNFITFSATMAQNEGLQAVSSKVSGTIAAVTGKRNPKSKFPLIPAGGWDLNDYNSKCNSCMACVTACPRHVLEPVFKLGQSMFPRLSFRAGWCPPDCVRCTEVCTTDALQMITVEEKSAIQIGHAEWIRENCISLSGQDCHACEKACPTEAIQMITNGRKIYPVINPSRCLGCGACENACPASPLKAIYVESYSPHRRC